MLMKTYTSQAVFKETLNILLPIPFRVQGFMIYLFSNLIKLGTLIGLEMLDVVRNYKLQLQSKSIIPDL